MCPSFDPVSSFWESGEKVRDRTGMAWPSRGGTSLLVVMSKRLIIPSMAPLAMNFPSGL